MNFEAMIPTMLGVAIQIALVAYLMGSNSSSLKALGDRLELLAQRFKELEDESKDGYSVRAETLKDVERIKAKLESLIEKVDEMNGIVHKLVEARIHERDKH